MGWFPRFNGRGDIATGSGTLEVNEQVVLLHGQPVLAHAPSWLDDSTVFFKGVGDRPQSLNLMTMVLRDRDAVGYIQMEAGGGVWAAAGLHKYGGRVIRVSVDPVTGWIAELVEYGGQNVDRSIFLNGAVIVQHQPVDLPCVRDGLLVWVLWTMRPNADREVWGCDGQDPPRSLRVFLPGWESAPVPVRTNGGPWVMVQTNLDLRIHPWGSDQGYLLPTGEDKNQYPDIVFLNGMLRVAYNDAHGHLIRPVPISLDQPRVDLSGADSVQPIEPIPDVNLALWFSAYDQDTGTFPRNCRFDKTLDGKPLFRYISGDPDGDPDAIERACELAGPGPVPRLAYVPHGVRFPRNCEWIGIECYHKVWETLEEFERARMARAIEANRPVVFIGQTYSSNANNVGFTPIKDGVMQPSVDPLALRRLVPVYGRLLINTPNAVGFRAFSAGTWRKTGYEDHPEIHADYRQLASTIRIPGAENGGSGGGGNVFTVRVNIEKSHVLRSDPKGCPITFDADTDSPLVWGRALIVDDHGNVPNGFNPEWYEVEWKHGAYHRGMFVKIVLDGEWRIKFECRNARGETGSAISATKVRVSSVPFEPPVDPVPGDLDDQTALVARVRRELYPELEGKRLDDTGQVNHEGKPILDERLGHERQAQITYHVAWELRAHGIGVFAAKPGSTNWGGKRPELPNGITTDAIGLADGKHWDNAIDGAGAGIPTWRLVPEINEEGGNNYENIKPRFHAAVQP